MNVRGLATRALDNQLWMVLLTVAAAGLAGCCGANGTKTGPGDAQAKGARGVDKGARGVDDAYFEGERWWVAPYREIVVNGSFFKGNTATCEDAQTRQPSAGAEWKNAVRLINATGLQYYFESEHSKLLDRIEVRVKLDDGSWSKSFTVRKQP
jgi:hypothetical protein